MRFTSPLLLLLLPILPVIAWMGWPASGRSWKRETVSLILRLIIVLSLILSLAGIELLRSSNDLAVVFLLDVSDSMPHEAVSAEMDYLRNALTGMAPDDQAAVVLFGEDALVERSMSVSRVLGAVTSIPITTQTDLAKAIQLGLALFPSGSARRMVILSDGIQTSGDAQAAAQFASAAGVQIFTVPFIIQPGSEALVTSVEAPTHLHPGEQFELNVTVQASAPVRATIRVLARDKVVYEQPHDLRRGQQTLSLQLTAGDPGFIEYQAQIVPERDVYYQNNHLDAFSQVEGPPRVLVVAPEVGETLPDGGTRPDEYSAILQSLQAAGFSVELIKPSLLASDLPGLAQYNSVVLVDVPAYELGPNQMKALQAYVRDLGGGLVAIGGPTSYGVGGYYGTPLEAALPVDMQIKDEKRRPSLGIVFIIDHSGSMGETSGGALKLELAKEAAARSLGLLFPTDRVGVIAFDDSASWVVPMTDLSNPAGITNAIGSIRVGGGTDILAGLQAMANVLPNDPSKVKHVILLTDGGADPTGIPELVRKLYTENGITLSTVAIGRDAAPFLKDLATVGGGRYHFTTDAASIPSIFTEETTLATRAYMVEEPFFPKLVNPSPILSGINSIPGLYGYVATSPKELAQVILESDKHDPILATWQYGLGRSIAFTSDATGHWAHDWVTWQNFPGFWAQAVQSTLGESQNVSLEMGVTLEAGKGHLTLDALNRAGEFLNGYQINANIVAPDGKSQAVTLQQIAPGRYEAFFDPQEQGVYLIRFTGQGANTGDGQFSTTEGWTMTYSPEYRQIGSNPDLLYQLATITGGKVATANPADAFVHNLKSSRSTRPIWPWLIFLAAVLLPLDIAVRRLIITRTDLVHMRERLVSRFMLRKRSSPMMQPSPRLEALFQAKERAHNNPLPASLTSVRQDTIQPPNVNDQTTAIPVDPKQNIQKGDRIPPEASSSLAETLLANKKRTKKRSG